MASLSFIVCVKKAGQSGHQHISHVGIGTTTTSYDRQVAVADIRAAIRSGDCFYSVSPSTGKAALVEPYDCPTCRTQTLRSAADKVTDNNLDNLSTCT